MTVAVSDSGPLTHLWQIDAWVAFRTFHVIHIAHQVRQEVTKHLPLGEFSVIANGKTVCAQHPVFKPQFQGLCSTDHCADAGHKVGGAVTDDLYLRRKWTLRAHGRQVVFVKKANESAQHVLMKAFLWALYLPTYPNLTVEVPIGDRYKPDLVALDPAGEPLFWGESGEVRVQKIRSLARRYRATHFALAKWDTRLDPYVAIVQEALSGVQRTAPIDLLCFPADSAERFIGDDGHIRIAHRYLEWVRLGSVSTANGT